MEKVIAKGRLFGVTTAWDAEQIKRMKQAPAFVTLVMEKVAFAWHAEDLPKHFEPAAHGTYGYAQRSKGYLKRKGARSDLEFTGSMKQELLSRASAVKRGTGVTLKMSARALNFVPNDSNPFAEKIQNSKGNWYPNTKREVRLITEAEQRGLALMATTHLVALFSGEKTK